jgi:hypothetical protein
MLAAIFAYIFGCGGARARRSADPPAAILPAAATPIAHGNHLSYRYEPRATQDAAQGQDAASPPAAHSQQRTPSSAAADDDEHNAAHQDSAPGTPPPHGAGPLEAAAAGQAGGGAPGAPLSARRLVRREDGSLAGLDNTHRKYATNRTVLGPRSTPPAELVARMLLFEEELQAAAAADA